MDTAKAKHLAQLEELAKYGVEAVMVLEVDANSSAMGVVLDPGNKELIIIMVGKIIS